MSQKTPSMTLHNQREINLICPSVDKSILIILLNLNTALNVVFIWMYSNNSYAKNRGTGFVWMTYNHIASTIIFHIFESNFISIKNHCQSELNESVIALKRNNAVWERDVEWKHKSFFFAPFMQFLLTWLLTQYGSGYWCRKNVIFSETRLNWQNRVRTI